MPSPFFQACGGREAIRIAVDGVERYFDTPVILAGSEPRCDLVLPHAPPLACVFVLFEGRLFTVPLDDEHVDGLEPLNYRHSGGSDPFASDGHRSTDLHFETFQSRKSGRLAVTPRLMLVGRGEPARFKINFDGVEPVHALVMRTSNGPWIADLTRRDLTLVNDGPVSAARLRTGDRVSIGRVELTAHVNDERSIVLAPPQPVDSVGPILQQVAQFQQQTFEQFREMLGSMTQMFGAVLNEHRQFVKEEFARLEQRTAPPPAVPPVPQLSAPPPPATPPPPPYTPPATVTPIPSAGPGHSAPPPNVELHAWLQNQVSNLEKAENSRWKKLLERFTK